jgi:2-iminobutanoate/2-iminopropanoate deaminase
MALNGNGRRAINTDAAPPPVGPYSQSIASGGFLFVAGQVGVDVGAGGLVEGGVEPQARQALENLKAIIEAAGAGMNDVVKTTIFLTDFNTFAQVNGVYGTYFDGDAPARSTVEVGRLPLNAEVEIEAIVALKGDRT